MAKGSDNKFPKMIITEGSAPSNADSGDQKLFIDSADHKLKRKNSTGTVTTIEGGGAGGDTTAVHVDTSGEINGIAEKTTLTGNDLFIIEDSAAGNVKKKVKQSNLGAGGAPTTSEYITTAADGGLSAEVVIPGFAGSADIAGAAGAGTAEEFDTNTDPFTWSSAPATHDSDTTIKSHLYVATSDGTEYFGTKSWSPAVAFDARCKLSVGTNQASSDVSFGLHIQNSDNSSRLLLVLGTIVASQQYSIKAWTYESGSYTARGSVWPIYGANQIYLRITRDGSNNCSFYWSSNGLLWQFIVTQALTLTVAKIGIRGSSSAAASMAMDWLRTDV